MQGAPSLGAPCFLSLQAGSVTVFVVACDLHSTREPKIAFAVEPAANRKLGALR